MIKVIHKLQVSSPSFRTTHNKNSIGKEPDTKEDCLAMVVAMAEVLTVPTRCSVLTPPQTAR